ncbi:MAG: response regulator transcription factor [Candidatus Nanopelagicales bacterium]|nr:response regulator transcription factor [Candidatus Nanopelagicales bacterium]MCF8541947.1 response regulator transcription factor [Candidatus Nanopelagicales bacterium]MCF8556572.1 response regulator transcription factor [Candidatus Nanopelagicales bacterium]
MRRLRVLLVEDNDFTRSTVGASLEAENCVVAAAVSSAREAMRSAQEHDIDCAVIDLHLGPGPSGIDLAHSLRKHDPDLGIVLLTSYQDPRLMSGHQRPLPPGAVYAVKNDVRSTSQLRQQIDMAVGDVPRPLGRAIGHVPLTDTQVELLRMVADGLTNAEIARRRVTTERAVATGLARIMRKLEIEPGDNESRRVLLMQAYHSLVGGPGGN